MLEQTLGIATKDGAMETFIVHPERGGPYPPVMLMMDAPGIREELRMMARRLATIGYYVLLPNLYYAPGGTQSMDPTCSKKAQPSRHGCARCAPR
jgi:carboxymethylenebutenolidase